MKKIIIILIIILINCGKDRLVRETTTIVEPEELVISPILTLKQEILNCSSVDDLCVFEPFLIPNTDPNTINGIIYPNEELINSNDLSIAPQLEFSFEYLDYSEIEKIEYKYIKYNPMGEKIVETSYKELNFTDNNYIVPIHVQSLGSGIVNTDPNEINQIEILTRTYTNIYYKTLIKFYMYSSLSFPLEIYRDENVMDTKYYKFETSDIHTLDIIHLKNNLASKLLLDLNFNINNTTKASIKTETISNFNESVGVYGPDIYLWQTYLSSNNTSSIVNPTFLIYTIDEYNEVNQIPYTLDNNQILIEKLLLKENENLSLFISSNFEKLNILGGHDFGTIYTNYSHCQFVENLDKCKCRYSPNINLLNLLFLEPDPFNITQTMQMINYTCGYILLMQDETLVPDCTNNPENLILNAEDNYKTNVSLLARLHKTQNSMFIDVYLKDYQNFGSVGDKYISFPDLESQSGEILGDQNLYGYVQ